MRAYLALCSQGFRQMTAYRLESWLGLLANLTYLVMFLAIWNVLLAGDAAALAEMVTYVLVTRVLAEFLFVPTWEVTHRFREGSIAVELLKPVSFPVRCLADFLGRSGFRVLQALPAFVIAALLLNVNLPAWTTLLLFLLSAALAWLINGLIQMAFLSLALWTSYFDEAQNVQMALSMVFGGWFLPLWVMPEWVQPLVRVLPFAGTYYTPAAIYAGRLAAGELAAAVATQAVWVLTLALLVNWEWRAGGRRLTVHGG